MLESTLPSKKFTVSTLNPQINWVPGTMANGFVHSEIDVRDDQDKLIAQFHFSSVNVHWNPNYDDMRKYVELFLGALRATGSDVVTEVAHTNP